MRNGLMKVHCVVLLACMGFLVTGGCGPDPIGRYNIIVETDSQLCKQTMRVDIVAVAEMGPKEKWENMSMKEYWSPGPDSTRKNKSVPAYEMEWNQEEPGESCEKTLEKKDPVWKEWKGGNARWLFILADTRGAKDETGNMDARRLVLPLDKSHWGFGVGSIKIRVTRDNVTLLTKLKKSP